MSLEKVHLRKLLRIFFAPKNVRTKLLRDDIRADLRSSDDEGGGDFHGPFWADAKDHALGLSDLHEETRARVAANITRARLYPALRDGFLGYWNERRRWRNEPLSRPDISPRAQLTLADLGVVKVENILAVESGPEFRRLIYGYFAEQPVLADEGARLGLWAMGQALPREALEDMRILDVLRSKSFAPPDVPFRGDEEEAFRRRYALALDDWNTLRKEYP